MPLYEYKCKEHGDFQKIKYKDGETEKCPECGKECDRKIGYIAHFEFKGFN